MPQPSAVISQLRSEHYDDLRELFRLYDCGTDPADYDPDWTLVAVVDDWAVGFLAAWVTKQPYVYLDNFLVHPQYRGTGIAVTLGKAMLAVLKQKKVTSGLTIRAIVTAPDLVDPLKQYGFRIVSAAVAMEKNANA